MTRKRLKKLLMGNGWSRKGANELIATLQWMRRTKSATLSYAEQFERYLKDEDFQLVLPF